MEGRDWCRRSGKRGGGAGSGNEPIYVDEECLEQISKKYYAQSNIKD